LIVGGGIKTTQQLTAAFDAGADIVVVGNAIESEPSRISEFVQCTRSYNVPNVK
jgi:heptaprenylglyceryl phosphate synthase